MGAGGLSGIQGGVDTPTAAVPGGGQPYPEGLVITVGVAIVELGEDLAQARMVVGRQGAAVSVGDGGWDRLGEGLQGVAATVGRGGITTSGPRLGDTAQTTFSRSSHTLLQVGAK
jgi:hypothetical protein